MEMSRVGHQTRAVMEGILLDLHAHHPLLEASGPGFMVGAGKGLQNSQVWAQWQPTSSVARLGSPILRMQFGRRP